MNGKRVISILLSLVLIMALLPVAAFATQPQIQYTMMLNGAMYSYNIQEVQKGASIQMAVEGITVDGVLAPADKVSYQWSELREDPGLPGGRFYEIAGATQSSYTVDSYAGVKQYECAITVEGSSTAYCTFYFMEDSLSLTGSANKACVYDEEYDQWVVKELSVGDSVTLTVTPQSTLDNPTYTYSWSGGTVYIPPDGVPEGEVTNQTSNTLTVEKFAGEQNYFCTVSDGNVTKSIFFSLQPKNTVTSSILVNGQVPGTYAGTYIYVTDPGEEVKIEIPASTTGSEVTHTWYYNTENSQIRRLTETSDTITHTKAAITQDNPYAWEVFECYVEDGNERIRYWLMLFCLDPETPLAEAKKIGAGTPNVSIQTSDTDLANSALEGKDLQIMQVGAPVEITLTTEKKDTVADAEKKAIDGKLGENSKVGMYLDMNLYKDVAGAQSQITETSSEIRLSVDLPEALLNKDPKVTRTYQIVRMHNGVAETLECTLDKEAGKLIFDTDKFSTYTVVFTDTAVVEETKPAETTEPTEATEATTAPTTATEATNPAEATKPAATNPNTGDAQSIALPAAIVLLSLCAAVMLTFRKKRI